MPRSTDAPAGEGETAPGASEERAFDEYLEAALRGRLEDVDSFCARHGGISDALRRRLEALRRVALEGTRRRPGRGDGR